MAAPEMRQVIGSTEIHVAAAATAAAEFGMWLRSFVGKVLAVLFNYDCVDNCG